MKNYYTQGSFNRGFLTCAASWLLPVIKLNGDVYCCQSEKIGTLKKNSFFEIWNNEKINKFRNNLLRIKQLPECVNCNLFYQDAFLIVHNNYLSYKNVNLEFPSEINYTKSSPKLAIIETKQVNDSRYLVEAYPIFSDEALLNLGQKQKTLLILE